jgi:GWxTD domain-containing protein
MGIPRAVALVESALAATPSVMGWVRPVILAPAGWLMGLPASQAETVLLHELAHIRRHDYLINLLQSAVEDLLFYHPAVWWVGRVMRRERENCCDDLVLVMGGDRRDYARTLATLEQFRSGEAALAASGGSLADRIQRLARPATGPRASAAPLVLAMALVCAGAVALPAWQTPAPAADPVRAPAAAAVADVAAEPAAPAANPDPAPAPAPVPQAAQADPYQKWLTEDVVYIIQDDEREAFNRLQSAEEKEHFIEQFWARRGVAVKEEHYRRIGYANERFADIRGAGWKTDRGRIYITMGPPDEKEVHPSGEGGSPPYEEWMYRKFQGGADRVMKFVDAARDGRYLLQILGGRLNGWVRIYPKPAAVRALPRAEMALPAVQPNGDYLFEGNRISVRVGVDGATFLSVSAPEARVTLNRVTRHDGGGEAVFQELTTTKLLTLEPGLYRVQAEMTGPDLITQEKLRAVTARLEELSQTYTSTHPNIVSLQNQLRNLESLRSNGSVTTALQFRVP